MAPLQQALSDEDLNRSERGIQDRDLAFGPFILRGANAELYREDDLVRLGNRARQILVALTSAPGQLFSKSDLIDKVWPDTTVVDNNLTVHVAALRRALGDGRDGAQYIVNVPGRGYRFVAAVRTAAIQASPHSFTARSAAVTNLPVRLRPAVGLTESIDQVLAKLESSNLVTICGPAGVGKTTLALHVAQARLHQHKDGVWLVDLAALNDAENVPLAIATTLRIEARSENPATALLLSLAQSSAFIVLDNCEHLIDAVADLAAAMLRQCPNLVLLTTSRESLRINGETIFVLAPLSAPPGDTDISVDDALSYPAVQLFIERVAAAMNDFTLTKEDAFSASLICRRLDGLPLAIEFASALVGAFSLADVATRLDDLFKMIQSNMRGAPLRHRTLTAALDWSYGLLSGTEQSALRRLAVFAGGFTLESAAAVTGVKDLGELGALLAKLHAKSLVTREVASKDLRFRLLETTRAYARELLKMNGEEIRVQQLHAEFYSELLRKHRLQLGNRDIAEDGAELDNIRAALRFAMGSQGDAALALSLTSGAVPVWLGLSLIAECRTRLREVQALLTADLASSSEGWDLDATLRITEMVSIGISEVDFAKWPVASEAAPAAAHTRRPDLADVLTRWVWHIRRGNAVQMERFAETYTAMVKSLNVSHFDSSRAWTDGLTAFQLGRLGRAKARLSDFLQLESPESRKVFVGRTGIDRVPGVYGALGATLCLLGDPDEGIRVAHMAETVGRATTKALPFCDGKIWTHVAYEIALSDPAMLTEGLDELVATASNQGLDSYLGYGLGLRGLLEARLLDDVAAEQSLGEGLDLVHRTGLEWASPWFHGQLALCMGRQGRLAEGLRVAETWMRRDGNPNSWCSPEFHRLVATLHQLNGDLHQSKSALEKAIAIASEQGSKAWFHRATRDLQQLYEMNPRCRGVYSAVS